jgi:hypothetical protein
MPCEQARSEARRASHAGNQAMDRGTILGLAVFVIRSDALRATRITQRDETRA